jgi:hypothetical protein
LCFLTSDPKEGKSFSYNLFDSDWAVLPCLDYNLGAGWGDSFFLFSSHPLVASRFSAMLRSLSSPRGQRYSIPLDRLFDICSGWK